MDTTTFAASPEKEKPPSMGGDKPFPPDLLQPEAYVVEFDGPRDRLSAQCWRLSQKSGTRIQLYAALI